MASETLSVPEEHLREVIAILRAGLKAKKRVTPAVREALEQWCADEEEYLDRQ
jgi:hypothetical protein